jgi:hypothetical protein
MMNAWPGGATLDVTGTFTKTVSDGGGQITIILPSDDDEVILMYAQFASQTHAGGGDAMTMDFTNSAGSSLASIASVTVDANQNVHIPHAFADSAVAVANDIGMKTVYQRLLSGTDRMVVTFADMKFATSETFTFSARFRSKTGAALTVTPSGGTWT